MRYKMNVYTRIILNVKCKRNNSFSLKRDPYEKIWDTNGNDVGTASHLSLKASCLFLYFFKQCWINEKFIRKMETSASECGVWLMLWIKNWIKYSWNCLLTSVLRVLIKLVVLIVDVDHSTSTSHHGHPLGKFGSDILLGKG